MKIYRRNSRGITLSELLIVIAVIGILAGVATPNFTSMLRRNRVQTVATKVLSALRQARSRAISLNRRIQISFDMTNKTYTTTRLAYTLYDPLSPDPYHPVVMSKEEPEALATDVSFDSENRVATITASPDPFIILFTPSGTVEIVSVPIASVQIENYEFTYEIRLYKGGQISMFSL